MRSSFHRFRSIINHNLLSISTHESYCGRVPVNPPSLSLYLFLSLYNKPKYCDSFCESIKWYEHTPYDWCSASTKCCRFRVCVCEWVIQRLVLWIALRECNRAHQFSFCDLSNSRMIFAHRIYIFSFAYLPLCPGLKRMESENIYMRSSETRLKANLTLFLTYTRQSSATEWKHRNHISKYFQIDLYCFHNMSVD